MPSGSRRLSIGLGVVIFIIMCWARLFLAERTFNIHWDTSIFLDGAWRVLQGQRPHHDFSSPVGPVTFLVLASGMKIMGVDLQGMGLGVVFCYAVVSLWTVALCHRLFHPIACLVAFIVIGSYVITPHVIGNALPGYTSYYNSLGYALFGLLLLDVLSRSDKAPFSRGFSSACAVLLMLFTKVTFGLAGAAALGCRLLFYKSSPIYRTGLLMGFSVSSLLMAIYLKFDLLSVFEDMQIVAYSRIRAYEVGRLPIRFLELTRPAWMLMGGLYFLRSLLVTPFNGKRFILNATEFAFFMILGLFLMTGIMQAPEPVLTCLVALCFACNALSMESFRDRVYLNSGTLLLCMCLILPPLKKNYSWVNHARRLPLKTDLVILGNGFRWDRSWGPVFDRYNDGLDLLRRHLSAVDRIMVVDDTNFFSAALQQPSPTQDLLYWHWGVTFHETALQKWHRFDPARIFGDVSLILIPHQEQQDTTILMFRKMYQEYLDQNFAIIERTSSWTLLRKRRAPAALGN